MGDLDRIKFLYKESAFINEAAIYNAASTLRDYIDELNKVVKDENCNIFESSINLPFDDRLITKVLEISKKKITDRLKYVILIGIGGSNLGAKAVYEAVAKGKTNLLFADTCSSRLLKQIELFLKRKIKSSQEILLCLISKSGKTTESIVNFEYLYSSLIKRLPDLKERVIVVSESESQLFKISKSLGFEVMLIPAMVIGRYSIFSAVGLLPLCLAGINIEKLNKGARDITQYCLKLDLDNPALVSAILIYLYYKKGFTINNNFFFNPELEGIGKWYRQLMAESLAKEYDLKGQRAQVGITPIVSIGSNDLHSMLQLYLAGPNDKLTTFVYSQEPNLDMALPSKPVFKNLLNHIEGKDISLIMRVIYEGVKKTYLKRKLPFVEIQLPQISEYYLGAYLQFKMIEMMYLGRLFNVDVFNQPNVEEYKSEARRILGDFE